MLSNPSNLYQRPQAAELRRRLVEPRRFIQVVAGPRQVGKSTLVQQLAGEIGPGVHYASADEPTLRGTEWIAQQWEAARLDAKEAGEAGVVLALDEVQKIPDWSETVKRLWDEDTRRKLPLRVVLLGSAPLLIARGMTESLAGRFELEHDDRQSTPRCCRFRRSIQTATPAAGRGRRHRARRVSCTAGIALDSSMSAFTESTVEEAALAWLEAAGWQGQAGNVHMPKLLFGERRVKVVERFVGRAG